MSIAKIEPTTKVKEWVKRINLMFEELRRREIFWKTESVAGQDTYEFPVSGSDKEAALKAFDINFQYSVQYGGVTLVPEDYRLTGRTLQFVNGAPLESGYPIIVRYLGRGMSSAPQQ